MRSGLAVPSVFGPAAAGPLVLPAVPPCVPWPPPKVCNLTARSRRASAGHSGQSMTCRIQQALKMPVYVP